MLEPTKKRLKITIEIVVSIDYYADLEIEKKLEDLRQYSEVEMTNIELVETEEENVNDL